ncbi:MAG: hypothetical protein RLZZ65_1400 [Bacteroidota bacterium]|mgnify:CR=1 FL=1|jgi:hypothetical protein
MLIEIKDKIISTQIFERQFVCDLNACKGACCIEGDGGAPVTEEEVKIIENYLPEIKPFMRPEGIEAIEKNGIVYLDDDFEPATTLVNGQECAFVYFDESNTAKCAIEKAQRLGKIDFIKPISCHLYPIRTKQFSEYMALNYEKWDICEPACACGEKLEVPVFKFLKEPLVRAFGNEFFEELEKVAKELENEKGPN